MGVLSKSARGGQSYRHTLLSTYDPGETLIETVVGRVLVRTSACDEGYRTTVLGGPLTGATVRSETERQARDAHKRVLAHAIVVRTPRGCD